MIENKIGSAKSLLKKENVGLRARFRLLVPFQKSRTNDMRHGTIIKT
jgi:hypothetical protein